MTVAKCTMCKAEHPNLNFSLFSGFYKPDILFALDWCESCELEEGYVISLEDILKEFSLDHISHDLGESSHRVTKLLRDYADKIDAEADKHKHEWGD